MKKLFNTFYDYTKEEYDEIWANGIFVLDANVLLNLYRYTEETRKELLQILNKISDRLWIPHQVGLEYHANRITVILEQIVAYDQITQSLSDSSQTVVSKLDEKFKKFKDRHPSIKIDSITQNINEYFTTLIEEAKEQKKLHPNLLEKDNILEIITDLFKDNVGDSYNQDQLDKIFSEGEKRYKIERPPGYEDLKEKQGEVKYHNDLIIKSEYGDLIVWKQIIEKAKSDEKSIIFITDDVKEDWWKIVKGRTIGPRDELINEFTFETNQSLLMYNTERFMQYASESLKSALSPEAIEEVQKLTKADKNSDNNDFYEFKRKMGELRDKYGDKKITYQLLTKDYDNTFRDNNINLKEFITDDLLHRVHNMMTRNIESDGAKNRSEVNIIIVTTLSMYHPNLEPSQLNKLSKLIFDELIKREFIAEYATQEGVFYFLP